MVSCSTSGVLLEDGCYVKKKKKKGEGSLVGVPIEQVVVKMSPEEIKAERKEEVAATKAVTGGGS